MVPALPCALACVMFVTSPGALAAQTPAVDSLRARVEAAEAAIEMLRSQLATEAASAVRTRSRTSLELSGRVLMHTFANSRRTNNADVPLFALPNAAGPEGGLALAIRQTVLGLAFSATDVLGGDFLGDLDVDFYGGQQPSTGGRTFPLIRLRTVRAAINWTHGELLLGQEQPLITNVNPQSLASVGVPGFTAAGNLWLWLPQVRGTVQTAGRVRFGLQGAVLAPTSGDPAGLFDTDFDPAEKTRKPYLQGRVRVSWGEDETAGEFGVGVHRGWLYDAANVERTSEALAASFVVPVGRRLELRGEAFDGQALRGLGGGGIGQGLGATGDPVRTRGGWGQLNLRASSRVLTGIGFGFDDPEDADVPAGGRLKNEVAEAHLHWRPSGPMVIGLEFRRARTRFASGPLTNDHLNLALGFEF